MPMTFVPIPKSGLFSTPDLCPALHSTKKQELQSLSEGMEETDITTGMFRAKRRSNSTEAFPHGSEGYIDFLGCPGLWFAWFQIKSTVISKKGLRNAWPYV